MNKLPNLPLPDDDGQPGKQAKPGTDLSVRQREYCRVKVATHKGDPKVAKQIGVSERSIRQWRADPKVRRYLAHLTDIAVNEAQGRIKATFAAAGPAMAARIVQLGTSKTAKPPHAYQVEALKAGLERLAGKPAPAQLQTAGVEIPTERGPIRIIFRSSAQHQEEPED
ncbi:MAG: hypothetical protein ACE5IZ_01150 [Dehalococcoidia bacterium]